MALDQHAKSDSELVQFWNEILEPKFTKYRHVLVGGLGKHSEAIFPRLAVKRGDHVLDVGCGFGDTAIQLASRVAPTGCVVGVDCVRGFLDIARRDAEMTPDLDVHFVQADVETAPFEPKFDHVFSRFGTMFFANPVAALRNIGRALKPGGAMTMIVWRRIEDNPWLKLAKDVALRHLPEPSDDGRSCGPGPFSMADEGLVRAQLASAGFDNVAFERVDAPIRVGDDVEDAIGFQLALGPAGEIYREAGDLATERHAALVGDLTAALAPYADESGVYLASSSWMVTARRP